MSDRTNIVQHYRTIVSNNPPAPSVLLEGEIGVEMNDPMKLWIGVPVALDPSGRKLLFDRSQNAWLEAPTDGQLYGRNGSLAVWQPALPIAGGTLTGPLTTPLGTSAAPAIQIGSAASGLWGSSSALNLKAGGITNTSFAVAGNTMNVPLTMAAGQPILTQAGNGGTNLGLALGALNNGLWASSSATAIVVQTNSTANTIFASTGNQMGVSLTMLSGTTLTLAADPAAALQPVTLQYYNAHLPGASATTPLMDGTAAIGVGTTWARADHVHPTDTSRAPLANPTFTGAVNAPTPAASANTLVATTAYVTNNAPVLTTQSGGTADYNAIDPSHFGLHNFGGPLTSTANGPPAVPSPAKSTVLSAYAANNGWLSQLYMGAELIAGLPSLFYRIMPGNAVWGAWVRIITDAGGAMTGPLTLAADPTLALGAATKQYVDAVRTLLTGSYLPLAGGTLSGGLHFGSAAASSTVDLTRHIDLFGGTFGLNITSARMNHVAPVGATQFFTAGDGTDILSITKGQITALTTISFGSTLASSPTDLSHHINLFGLNGYGFSITSGELNIVAGGVASLEVGSAVVIATVPVQLPADPVAALQAATKQYVDGKSAAPIAPRNFLINPVFRVWQRPGGPYTTQGYTIDRWLLQLSGGDTASVSRVALADADRAAIGDERALYALQNVFTGSATAGSSNLVVQRNEDVSALSGKVVTVSFWARCLAGTMLIPVGAQQYFGTGGSPSASVNVATQNVTIGTAWARYSVTFNLPSIAGKTIGTNSNDFTAFNIYGSLQGTVVQSGTVQFWGMQGEIGNPTPLEIPARGQDLLACQRFFHPVAMYLGIFNTGAGQAAGASASFLTPMRGAPTLTISFNGSSNFTTGAPGLQGSSSVYMAGSSQAGTNTSINLIINCDAEL